MAKQKYAPTIKVTRKLKTQSQFKSATFIIF